MDVIDGVLSNLNTWLVMFVVGVVIWALRQILPDAIEGTRVWRTILRVLPIVLGAAIALIPGLRPVPENLTQSAAVGLIGGSFATTAYELLREIVGKELKKKLGSRVGRKSEAPGAE
jgi:apolipoprotein N-acyltransferase